MYYRVCCQWCRIGERRSQEGRDAEILGLEELEIRFEQGYTEQD